MKQDSLNNFIDESYKKPPEKNSETNETILNSPDNTCSRIISQLIEHGRRNVRAPKNIFVVIDNFIKKVWTVPIKKNAQSITNNQLFWKNLKSYQREPKLIETDEGSELVKNSLTNLCENNGNKRSSRNSSVGVAFAGKFNRNIRDLLKKPVSQRSFADWVDILSTIAAEFIRRIHFSTKLTQIQASLKKNVKVVFEISKMKKNNNQNSNGSYWKVFWWK